MLQVYIERARPETKGLVSCLAAMAIIATYVIMYCSLISVIVTDELEQNFETLFLLSEHIEQCQFALRTCQVDPRTTPHLEQTPHLEPLWAFVLEHLSVTLFSQHVGKQGTL